MERLFYNSKGYVNKIYNKMSTLFFEGIKVWTHKPSALVQIKLKFGNAGFCGRRETQEPGEKPLEQDENQQRTQPANETASPGIEPGSQRWNAHVYTPFDACSFTSVKEIAEWMVHRPMGEATRIIVPNTHFPVRKVNGYISRRTLETKNSSSF